MSLRKSGLAINDFLFCNANYYVYQTYESNSISFHLLTNLACNVMYTNRMRENKLGCIKLPIWNVSPTTQLIDGRPNILDHKESGLTNITKKEHRIRLKNKRNENEVPPSGLPGSNAKRLAYF